MKGKRIILTGDVNAKSELRYDRQLTIGERSMKRI